MARNQLIRVRRDTAANWTSVNPTLAAGEIGFETDTNKFKIGDGSTEWSGLTDYFEAGVGSKVIQFAASDETTPLTTGTAKITFRVPYAMTLTSVRISLTTAQTSGSILTVDINVNGVSILSTKLTIDNGEKTSVTADIQAVISNANIPDDAEVSLDIDGLGDGTAAGLKGALIGS
jgi:hypothetical protein